MDNKFAFVFPGQGSQSMGMLQALFEKYSIVGETFKQASQVLGYDLWELVQQGPADLLNQTEFTQPALLVASVSIWKIWQQLTKPEPAYLAGHSLGEYSALVCANAISLTDAVSLVAERGRLMQRAVPKGEGAMAAIIGLDEDQVKAACSQAQDQNQHVSPANYNSIGQIVIAGHLTAVTKAMELAKAAGARLVTLLPVSVPSHCVLMQQAAQQLAEKLNHIQVNSPRIPVIQNVDAAVHSDPQAIRDALIQQLYSPVRWVETIQFLKNVGINIYYECGPGNVLSGLIKRIDKGMQTFLLNQPENFAA